MIKDCIKSAPTIEEAKAAALLELGLSEEDIYTVEVLQAPVKKTLGLFGGKPAQVKVSVEVPDEVKPAEKKPEKKENNQPKKADKKKEKAPKQDSPVEVAIIAKKKDALKKTDEYNKAAQYVKGIILGLGMENCEVEVFADDEEIAFDVNCGDDYGIVIGRRGETLDAIQYLARMVANKGSSGYKRVSVNVGDYREKRAAVLTALAKKNASRAVRTGRNIVLEPMNPYERRIIHTAVQDVEGATSYSTGVDLERRVIIAPENGGKGSSEYRERGGRNDRGRRPKREPYVPQVDENREKKSDYSGSSLYGKIEVNKNEEE
ncbi:MAG: RNA-binding cell elongation regulator Jag/EloR [Clostridiaceae bacterium]|nr:RNA-binding cell elongation regulator Jag/EloR [Clostridiaceae bacterium]